MTLISSEKHRFLTKIFLANSVALALVVAGCGGSGGNDGEEDAGPSGTDAGPARTDAGPPSDGGPRDAATVDAGRSDGGTAADGGPMRVDGGTMPGTDGGRTDAGSGGGTDAGPGGGGTDAGPGGGGTDAGPASDAGMTPVDAGFDVCAHCDSNATCMGGATCVCNTGYVGDGFACTDENECTRASSPCDTHATCMNTVGSFTCTCDTGYTGSGMSCTDIDECATANGGCDALATCTNTPGGRTCGACPAGYTGTGDTMCVDINECATGNGGCDALTTCSNTPGGRTCGACPSGYSGTGETSCTDINECATGNGGCDALTMCTNTVGGRTCGACPVGYTGTGDTMCVDINECATGNGGCDALTSCTNTPGGRVCGACPSGYTGSGVSGCTDINECTTGTYPCLPAAQASCANTPGSVTCTCNAGGTGDGRTSCTFRRSCYDILVNAPSSTSGIYTIDPDGAAGAIVPFPVYCDMVTDGGGWTLVGRSVRAGAADTGCGNGDAISTNFGWRSARGSVTDDSQPYSLDVVGHGLTGFTEVMFGAYTTGKTWGANVYKHTVPVNFVTTYAASHYQVGPNSAKVVAGGAGCAAGTGPAMFDWIGYTNNTTNFHFRDVDGNSWGLYQNQFYSCYNDCTLGGNLNGQLGMIMVREKVNETSCNDLNPRVRRNDVYMVDPDGPNTGSAAYAAYCDMNTAGGGWTLALKANGSTAAWQYDGAIWTNGNTGVTNSPALDTTDAKLGTFMNMPFTQVLVGMGASPTTMSYLPVTATGTSLHAVMTNGNTLLATNVGRDSWRAMSATGSLQASCNQEGLNNIVPGNAAYARVRIGIIANQEVDCGSPDSFLGIGGQISAGGCNPTTISVGNVGGCTTLPVANVSVSQYGAAFVRNVPARVSCRAHRAAGIVRDGIYPIDPDGAGGEAPYSAYCDMTTAGGGWTLVTLNGTQGVNGSAARPGCATSSGAGCTGTVSYPYWRGNNYPRPGAAHFGPLTTVTADLAGVRGTGTTANYYSIDAATLWTAAGTTREFIAFVGGAVDTYITGTLPSTCNFFDGSTICGEANAGAAGHGPFTVTTAAGATVTTTAYACTTGAGLIGGDPFNEFGLHILDGLDTNVGAHCYGTASNKGFQDYGRLYTTFNSSDGSYWNFGVHSSFPETAATGGTTYFNTVGYLMIR